MAEEVLEIMSVGIFGNGLPSAIWLTGQSFEWFTVVANTETV